MDKTSLDFPFLSNIGFMLTYRCTIACPHCIVEAGPHRSEEVQLEHAFDWIGQFERYRPDMVRGLALTGGEPFYNLDLLKQVTAYGHSQGMIISVVTNGYWATTPEQTRAILDQLPFIQVMSISTDVFHQAAIPFSNVLHIIEACKIRRISYNLAVCTDNEDDPGYLQIMDEIRAVGETDKVSVSTIFPVGRAHRRMKNFHYSMDTQPSISACAMASSPIIFPDGNVIACIGPVLTLPVGHPLYLGNLFEESLESILDRAELNYLLHAVRIWGPRKLVSLLTDHGYGNLLPGEYIHDCICDVCFKLFSDSKIQTALSEIFNNEELRLTIAYGRVYYLGETRMAEKMGLGVRADAAVD